MMLARRSLAILLLLCMPAVSTASADDAGPTEPAPDPAALERDVASLRSCREMRTDACPELDRVVKAGGAAVPALQSLLRRGDPDAKKRAVAAMGLIGTADVIQPLLDALADSKKDTPMMIAIGDALGIAGRASPGRVVGRLEELLSSSEIRDKILAANTLGSVRSAAAVPALLRVLEHYHPKVKSAAVLALGAIGDASAVAGLVDLLADPRTVWPVRAEIVQAVGQLGQASAAPALMVELSHPRPEVRRAAATSLGQLAAAYTVPALSRAVSDSEVVGEAALAIGKIGDHHGTSALLRAVADADLSAEAQTQVFWALGMLKDAAALPTLEGVLQGSDDRLVYLAAEAMGRIGRPESTDALVSLLDSRESDIRDMAIWSLERITGETFGQDTQQWRRWLLAKDAPSPTPGETP